MVTTAFKKAYKLLNKEQREAVDQIEGPVAVIAGPGTGKTTILTLRIANILLKTDTPPDGILALTFTESGAKSMRMKLREIIGPRADEVRIHTFHGFAASIIAEFNDHFVHISRAKQITDIEAEQLIRKILKDKKVVELRPLGEPDFYVGKILAAISEAKREAWTPEMIRSFARGEVERVKNNKHSISVKGRGMGKLKAEAEKRIKRCQRTIIFSAVYQEYERRKKEERKIDFDDLIFELLVALRKDKLLLQLLQEKFLYILVDEHQDTNDSQNAIVSLLAQFFDSPNLFVVGDEKQAIYRFQGASVENFLRFQNLWKSMKTITLENNYRSPQSILDASHSLILNNAVTSAIRLKSYTKKTKLIEVVAAGNKLAEEKYLVQKLHQVIKSGRKESVAVIVRRNRDTEQILSVLQNAGIEAAAERGANIFDHPIGRLFFELIQFLADTSKIESFTGTVAGRLWNLDFATEVKVIKMARSNRLSEIEKEIPNLAILRKEISKSGALNYLYLAAELSKLERLASSNSLHTEVWREIISLAEKIATAKNISDPRELIYELLSYRDSAKKRSIKVKSGNLDSQITIMTAHSSKGLEFDYVFLPRATEESWIGRKLGNYFVLPKEGAAGDEIRDERRLFYVALTRARRQVVISYALEDSDSTAFTKLRFIDELDPKHLTKIELEKTLDLATNQKWEKVVSANKKEQIDYAKKVMVENGLSVTALNHFLSCPSEFFYKSILKLPEPPTASSEKGNAMHEAMARVWQNKNKSVKNIQKIIEGTIMGYFKKSLLPVFEKEMIVEELLADAPLVALALESHFTQGGKASVEKWVEVPIALEYGGKNVKFNLHGKLDVLIENGDKVFISDYKTASKKNDEKYFRQLVFYKILVENNSRLKGKQVEPSLVFIKPDAKGRCPTVSPPIEKDDIAKVQAQIHSLVGSIWSGSLLAARCADSECKYCGLKNLN